MTRRPEWTRVPLDDNYWTTVEVIGDHIVHSIPSGYATGAGVEKSNVLHKAAMTEAIAPGAPTILISDYSLFKGATLEARRSFVADLREREKLAAIVFYDIPPLFLLSIKLGRRFLGIPIPIKTAANYDDAIRRALEILEDHGVEDLPAAMAQESESVKPESGILDLDGYRVRYRVIDNHIDDLLELISTIEWETDGPVEIAWKHAPDHPLAPVVDALELIKADVTELFRTRTQTEAALRASEERYRNILDSIVDGYYEIDFDGQLLFCNDSLLRIFGYSRDDALNTDPKLLMDDPNRLVAIDTFRQVLESGEPAHTGDWEMLRKDGTTINVEASISLITGQDGRPTGFRGIIRDISRRVRSASEKADLEAQLQRSQRMEAIGTLAGGIAHNFNNLLMGIQGNISLLKREHPPDSPHIARLDTVEALVDGGSRLTSQLLGYARAGSVDVRTVDLNSLVLDTTETFGLTRREFRIHLDLTDGGLPITVDPAQIDQALLNLLINAADAMPGGGDITVTSRRVPHSELDGDSLEVTDGDHAVISVQDTGCGMDAETIEHIFEPFFTTKGMSGGTGLGLASTYGIIRAHSGLIDVRSAVDEGSTFSFSFPIATEELEPAEETNETPVSGEGTILVVEDDEAVLEACSSMLSLLNYIPVCVGSGREAIDIYSARKDEIDLVVLDLILTDLGGAEVFDAIRAVDPEACVLLSSGYSIDGEAASLLERGCDDFIQKPFTMQQLSRKIEKLLRRNS